jgi:hypothetical protein
LCEEIESKLSLVAFGNLAEKKIVHPAFASKSNLHIFAFFKMDLWATNSTKIKSHKGVEFPIVDVLKLSIEVSFFYLLE